MLSDQLIKKLNLNKFNTISLFNNAKEENVISKETFETTQLSKQYDCVFSFCYSLKEMKTTIFSLAKQQSLIENGVLYLLYPKQKNILGHKPIHRDAIFPYLNVDEETGYVVGTSYKFNKMVSLDDNYTLIGLKYDLKKRKDAPSQCVDDYIDNIEILKNKLLNYPEQLEFFKKLSFGYQKDWARYVYSAKQITTQEKRFDEMIHLFSLGFKSKNLYQQSLKK